ncbi:MAG: class I SAM-dependent methyltransferase [Dysgonomonas sp.]
MRKVLNKVIPAPILLWYKKWYKKRNSHSEKFQGKSPQEIFTDIYNTNHWTSPESISGPGSDSEQTTTLVDGLNSLIKENNIKSILDIPCGDFNWMQKVDLEGIDYIGADIVEALISENQQKYTAENIRFEVLDLISDKLPKVDILVVRDCLVHLSLENIYNSVKNIKSSGAKYLLATTFPEHSVNFDIQTGEWRPLNLQIKPFKFPKPLLIINEGCTEVKGRFNDKSMALWEIAQIELPPAPYKE